MYDVCGVKWNPYILSGGWEARGQRNPKRAATTAPKQEVNAIRKGKKSSESSERGGDTSLHASTCRARDQASWILSVRDLVPGFSCKVHLKWCISDEQLDAFD